MTKVFDNIVYSLQKSGGVSRFWSKITEPYLASATFIERDDATDNIYRQSQTLAVRRPDHPLFKRLARYLNMRKRFSSTPYIFHSSYYRVNRAPGAINVTTIHDLIYERFGGGLGQRIHVAQKRLSLSAADCIVCVSEHTRNDLYYYYPFTRDKRVLVIPNGVDPVAQAAPGPVGAAVAAAAAAGPYFLYVGHRGACKGFDRVAAALKLCNKDWKCVVVGDALQDAELAALAAAGVAGRVVGVGRVSDAELSFLYGKAEFFFFPSLYEGFGIPPLEAMQQGCPVLASNRSSVPEVVADAGVLFDPDDQASLAAGIARVTSPQGRQDLVEKGYLRAAAMSWDAAAEAYRTLYQELLDGHR